MLMIDRFEGEYALCEGDSQGLVPILRALLPAEAAEGDILVPAGEGYGIDREATDRRRRQILSRYRDLWQDDEE